MQDSRFNMIVNENEKQCLNNLTDEVEAFDLSSFKF
jgi:hypothetical protein